jgi:plastocyanin
MSRGKTLQREESMRPNRFVMAAGLAVVAACGGSSSSTPGAQVSISDFSFSPSTLSIKAGTTVTWTNSGPMTHTTVSDTGVWGSANLAPPTGGGGGYGGGTAGGSFTFTFPTPGSYPYHCSLHPPSSYPNFVGTITVTQ